MKKIINIPFMGFYQSRIDSEIDWVLEQEMERLQESLPEALQEGLLDGRQLWEYADFPAIWQAISRVYAGAFNEYVENESGLDLELGFEKLISPREYNFVTDQIDCAIPLEKVLELYGRVKQSQLALTIRWRHTSRSGFISFYSNDLQEWLDKPLEDWDHNELGTLLLAFMEQELSEDWEDAVLDKIREDIDDIVLMHLDVDKFLRDLEDQGDDE